MMSCKEASRLVCESLDRDLPWYQCWQVRFHVILCSSCTRFRRQMLRLRGLVRQCGCADGDIALVGREGLSEEARGRIKRALDGTAPESTDSDRGSSE
ncbi:MAG: zf-HC2 domain-containing protein [Gemmataceae bacterium]